MDNEDKIIVIDFSPWAPIEAFGLGNEWGIIKICEIYEILEMFEIFEMPRLRNAKDK